MKIKTLLLAFMLLIGINTHAADTPMGTVVWFDIRTTNSQKAEDFYGKLFGWQFNEIFQGYKMITVDGKGIGGLAAQSSAVKKDQGTMLYFSVNDLKASYVLALSLGAQRKLEPTNIQGFGAYAIIQDIDGNEI